MRRDMELIRELMLKLEEFPSQPGRRMHFYGDDPLILVEGWTREEHEAHLAMVYDAGYVVSADNIDRMASGQWIFSRLSREGHDFVDSVRDPDVWRKTKEGATKAGNLTLGFVKDLALAYAKQAVKERLGIEL